VGPIRRAISLIVAMLLTIAGLAGVIWFLFFDLFYSYPMAGASGFVLAVGAMWLYSDFTDATPKA